MSRSWNYVGFNPAAKEILEKTKIVGSRDIVEKDLDGNITKVYSAHITELAHQKVEYYREDVWYESENVFYTYTFDDGRVLEDYTQEEPWRSGPVTFMALRDAVTKEPVTETLWTSDEIGEYV